MSRGGYDWLRTRLEAEQRQARMLKEESEGSVVSNPVPTIQRHIQWCEVQKKRSGKYVNDKVEAAAKRIVSSIFIYTDLVTLCSD